MDYNKQLLKHYENIWKTSPTTLRWDKGPMLSLNSEFKVYEFPPLGSRQSWVYATSGMADLACKIPMELHLYSSKQDQSLSELLTVVAHYNLTSKNHLNVSHSVNFGRDWIEGSNANYGLISLPYLEGPNLENFSFEGREVRCLWLIPITAKELAFKKAYGLDALEEVFEAANFNYANPFRQSVI